MRPYFAPGLSLKKKTNKINENMNLLFPSQGSNLHNCDLLNFCSKEHSIKGKADVKRLAENHCAFD